MLKILADAFGQDAAHLAAEEQQQLLSRLLGRLAHEIRNPLSSLDIHVQLLEEDLAQLTPPARAQVASRLEIIHGELHRLENTVKHFLRLARPTDLDPTPVDLAQLIRHVCQLLRPEADVRQIELTSSLAEPLPLVLADSGQLTQALVNLIVNALQAVPPGGRIEVAARSTPSAMQFPLPLERSGNLPVVGEQGAGQQEHPAHDGEVLLEVRDSGPGIPPSQLAAIFEPYFTTKDEGSGLGLWIAQQITIAHGGTLRAANAPGGGAIFTMRLPVSRRAPEKDSPR